MAQHNFNSFADFWPHYVAEHSQPRTRTLHAAGTAVSVALALAFLMKRKWRFLPLALLPGYGTAWFAHYFIERNRPATFDHPLWSLLGDYKMIGMMATGKMNAEVARVLDER